MGSQKTQVPLPELVHLSFKPLIFWFRVVVTAEVVIGDGHAGRGHFRLFSGVWSLSRAYGGALSFWCSHWEAAHFDVSAGGHLKAADCSGRWDGFRADPGRGLRFMNSVFRLERDDGDDEEEDDDDDVVVEDGVLEEDETMTAGSWAVPGSWSLATKTWNGERGCTWTCCTNLWGIISEA